MGCECIAAPTLGAVLETGPCVGLAVLEATLDGHVLGGLDALGEELALGGLGHAGVVGEVYVSGDDDWGGW